MKMVVLGGGESGIGAALLGKKKGYDVWVSDLNRIAGKYKDVLIQAEISFEEGTHTWAQMAGAGLVIKSPGIPDSVPIVKQFDELGVEVIDEVELAFRNKGNAKVVAITGSNGKTTTAYLTAHLFRKAGLKTALVGNVGKSFAAKVAEGTVIEVFVVEVSSFQLDRIKQFKPDVAILLNITPDHLDRYNYELANYVASKMRITAQQNSSDVLVYCEDDEILKEAIKNRKGRARLMPFTFENKHQEGAWVAEAKIIIKTNAKRIEIPMEELA